MPPPPLRLLWLWLCSEAVAGQLHGQKTKTSLSPHYESAAAERNAQSRGWHAVSGEVDGGARGAGAQAPWLDTVNRIPAEPPGPEAHRHRRAVRKAPLGASPLRTDGNAAATPAPRPTRLGPTCGTGRTGRNQRQRRSAKPGGMLRDGAAAVAQEQEAAPPFGLNASDYEEVEQEVEEVEEVDYPLPDFPDATPFAPGKPRTRRKQVKNPFYPVTAEACGAYAVMAAALVLFAAGVAGNVSVMCIVCHNYYMRSVSNSLLANLALWDFLVLFFCLPLVVFRELTETWLLGEFSCRIVPYLEVASLGVTTFTLCALCIDRFRAATNVQLYYEMIENWASTAAKLAVIWVGALLLALPELLIRQLVAEDGDAAPCERCVIRISTELPDTLYVLGLTYDGARLWWYFGCYFCLPTLFTICSSLVTARKIRRAERACARAGKKQIQLESQMNCAVVALAILYGFCVIPENICNIVGAYMAAGVPARTLDVLQLVSQLLLFCKSAVTPVLLFCLCQPFTKSFLDCCCCCCVECGPPRTAAADNECAATELELSPFSTIRREASTSAAYAAVGTHC